MDIGVFASVAIVGWVGMGGVGNAGKPAGDENSSPAPDPNAAALSRAPQAIAGEFFAGKSCALCGHPVERPLHARHPAALRSPAGVTTQWTELPPAALEQAIKTHAPVCWNCHVAEEFRRQYPQLVTDRPAHDA